MTFFARRARNAATLTAVALSVALVLAGCGGSSGGEAGGVKIVKKGDLTVCTHLPYKPFQYRDSSGTVVGFDVDLIGLVTKELKLKQTTVDVDWNQVISGAAFKAKKCDLGMGAMTITPERQKAILISDPYFDATQAMLVKSDTSYQSLADLSGMKVGVQSDTTGAAYADKYAKKYDYTVVVFDDSSIEANGVKSGRVDAAINDNGPWYDFAKSNPDTTVSTEFNTGEQYGFAGLRDDANAKKLMDKLNAAIAKAKQDGTYDEIAQKWFGKVPGNVAG